MCVLSFPASYPECSDLPASPLLKINTTTTMMGRKVPAVWSDCTIVNGSVPDR